MMEDQNKIKKDYDIQNFVFDSKNIKDFNIIPSRRQISSTHVKAIRRILDKSKNPISILIVNKRGNEIRLIDGNHRYEAIKEYFNSKETNRNSKIECTLKVYHNLSDEEERQVYSDEAKRKNESYEDHLNMYKDTLVFWKLLNDPLNEFPCQVTIYPAKNGLKFRVILNAINTSKKSQINSYNADYLNKDELIDFANNLTFDDFKEFKAFLLFFIKVFGAIDEENLFVKPQYLLPLFDIYVKNKEYAKDPNYISRFERIIGRSDLITYKSAASRENHNKIRELMLKYMNYHIARNLFV